MEPISLRPVLVYIQVPPHHTQTHGGGGEVPTSDKSGTFPGRRGRGQQNMETGEGIVDIVHVCYKSTKWGQEWGHLRLEESGGTPSYLPSSLCI